MIKQRKNLSVTVKQRIYDIVKRKINYKVQCINSKINKIIANIQKYTHGQFNKAFVKLYQYSTPFVIISIFSCLLFDKRRINSSKEEL